MVLVLVRNQHGIEFGDVFAQHLLPKVWTGIDGHHHLVGLDEDGRAQAFVTWILRLTNGTLATDDGHPL